MSDIKDLIAKIKLIDLNKNQVEDTGIKIKENSVQVDESKVEEPKIEAPKVEEPKVEDKKEE